MVASQEVELGNGYPYNLIAAPLHQNNFDKVSFAKHIVQAYGQAYANITNDYTQSAINLSAIGNLESSVNLVATILIEGLQKQKTSSVKTTIKACRNNLICTCFDEKSYIDLDHFLRNLQTNLNQLQFSNDKEGHGIKDRLQKAIDECLKNIKSAIISNIVGSNLRKAQGISIYFPERQIHPSYPRTTFAASNQWYNFLRLYLG